MDECQLGGAQLSARREKLLKRLLERVRRRNRNTYQKRDNKAEHKTSYVDFVFCLLMPRGSVLTLYAEISVT